MSIFDHVKKTRLTNAHGEVNFLKIIDGTVDVSPLEIVQPAKEGYIVGHSESGHHHVLEREGVTVHRGTEKGMQILRALITKPVPVRQLAGGNAHEQQIIEPGEYLITNNVEYDPFMQQARRVAD